MVTALTTIDNPFNPLDEFEKWFIFDTVVKGYNSCAYLARIAKTSDQLTDAENEDEIERAIDEIVRFNPGMYKKIVKGQSTKDVVKKKNENIS